SALAGDIEIKRLQDQVGFQRLVIAQRQREVPRALAHCLACEFGSSRCFSRSTRSSPPSFSKSTDCPPPRAPQAVPAGLPPPLSRPPRSPRTPDARSMSRARRQAPPPRGASRPVPGPEPETPGPLKPVHGADDLLVIAGSLRCCLFHSRVCARQHASRRSFYDAIRRLIRVRAGGNFMSIPLAIIPFTRSNLTALCFPVRRPWFPSPIARSRYDF